MRYSIGDSLVHIYLPSPVIEPPVLDLDSAKIFNMNQRYVTASMKSYETVVRNVQYSLSSAKEDVLLRAESNSIREEAQRLGGDISGVSLLEWDTRSGSPGYDFSINKIPMIR